MKYHKSHPKYYRYKHNKPLAYHKEQIGPKSWLENYLMNFNSLKIKLFVTSSPYTSGKHDLHWFFTNTVYIYNESRYINYRCLHQCLIYLTIWVINNNLTGYCIPSLIVQAFLFSCCNWGKDMLIFFSDHIAICCPWEAKVFLFPLVHCHISILLYTKKNMYICLSNTCIFSKYDRNLNEIFIKNLKTHFFWCLIHHW